MTKILSVMFNVILFPFRFVWGVITWPLKALWNWFTYEEPRRQRVRIVDFPDPQPPIPDDPNWLPPNAKIVRDPYDEITAWYDARRARKEPDTKNIIELMADILPEGKINPRDWADPPRRRSGGMSSSPYTVMKNPLSYSTRNPCEFTILNESMGPNGKLVKNPRAKLFKPRPYEKVLFEDPSEQSTYDA